jgi:hypothetical protein
LILVFDFAFVSPLAVIQRSAATKDLSSIAAASQNARAVPVFVFAFRCHPDRGPPLPDEGSVFDCSHAERPHRRIGIEARITKNAQEH